MKPSLPEGFESFADEVQAEVESIEGYLSPKEIRFLALIGAAPTASGDVLEIGSFKGKSTVILARAAARAGQDRIFAVDPMAPTRVSDPRGSVSKADGSSFPDFQRNLEDRGLREHVEFARCDSGELAMTWDRPLRLLWIDGDHTYRGAKTDFDGFAPYLADGAIIALHDVLHACEGGVRVFMEDILLSPNFGPCGLVGSIAWAQFRTDETATAAHRATKLRLYRGLSRLIPFVALGGQKAPIDQHKYKLARSRIPHGRVDPESWVKAVR